MNLSLLGGMIRRDEAARRFGEAPGPEGGPWRAPCGDHELFMQSDGWPLARGSSGRSAAVLRGYAILPSPSRLLRPGDLDRPLVDSMASGGARFVDWEGSFTLAFADADAGRVRLYRNLVGAGFTYYAETPTGFFWSSNLARLARFLDPGPGANQAVLPTYFLYRFVPGRETLFQGIYRLMPGECIEFSSSGLRRDQRITVASLRQGSWSEGNAVEGVNAVMARVVADCEAASPASANLLSGGVDSSYIQSILNQIRGAEGAPRETFTVFLDHPTTRGDAEYARTAAEALGTRHRLVEVTGPSSPDYLIETIEGTGEPPNHFQCVYFRRLARAMSLAGYPGAFCGEGADSLFGVGPTANIQKALRYRGLLPWGWLRRGAARLASKAGRPRQAASFALADRLYDLDEVSHPVNQVGMFTQSDLVARCFGEDGVRAGIAYRRGLLRDYQVGDDPLEQVNFAGYLGEAMDSGSLWAALFNLEGGELLCPFLDSRLIRLVVNIDPRERYPYCRPKQLLKLALKRSAPAFLADRRKLGFGQPIFQWCDEGEPLRPLVERIGNHPFLGPGTLKAATETPGWFLYNLLCYDLWHKIFIENESPRPAGMGSLAGASYE